MAMNGSARGDADYNAIMAANPNWGKLSASEMNTAKMYFEVLFGADTTYIKANMDVLPTGLTGPGLQNPIGQPVHVSLVTGDGATTVAENLSGTGSVI